MSQVSVDSPAQTSSIGSKPNAPTRTGPARIVLLVLGLIACLLWAQSPHAAEAHATLVRSDPPVNARLLDSPTTVTAFYTESLETQLSSMKVLDGAGNHFEKGDVTFGPDPAQMSVAVETLDPGFYAVQWETLSDLDGHLLKGSIPFTVLNPDGSEPSGPRPSAEVTSGFSITSARPADVATKWINILGAVLVVGGLAFSVAVSRPALRALSPQLREDGLKARRRNLALVTSLGLALLAATGVSEILLKANTLGGLDLIDDALRTDWGRYWIQRQVLLAVMVIAFAAILLRRNLSDVLSEAGLALMLAAGCLYLLVIALVGHGASINGSFWLVAVDFTHLLATSVWVGMLVQLALLIGWARSRDVTDRDEVMVAHMRRFSPIAATSVVILLATGSANALSQLPDFSAIFETVYGQVLIIKLCLIAALLLVAAVNAFYLRPRIDAPRTVAGPAADASMRTQLWRIIRIEIGLAILVLLVTAALVQYPTSRQQRSAEANVAASAGAAPSFDAIQTAGDVDVQLSISPNQVGTNSFLIYVFPPSSGEPAEISRVRLRFQSPDESVGPSVAVADKTGDNSYKVIGPFLSQPGSWQVGVELRRVGADDVTAGFGVGVTGVGAAEQSDRFAYPLEVGSWAAVAAAIAALLALLAYIWIGRWPLRPASAGESSV
jgi:copper transport protein